MRHCRTKDKQILLPEPQQFPHLIDLMENCTLIVTDSQHHGHMALYNYNGSLNFTPGVNRNTVT